MEVTKYEPGTFSWVDYSTKDLEGAKAFYGELFDWSFVEVPTPDEPYIVAQIDGKEVAGLMRLTTEQAGASPYWSSYVTVEDASATAARIKDLGGRVLVEPSDATEAGRMAVVADPRGAVFCLWQPGKAIGAVLVNEPNTFCWNELYTDDLDAAEQFYTRLFGWNSKHAIASNNAKLVELYNGERPAATMMEIQPEWGPMPPVWGVYFAVEDCDAAVKRAKELGAKVASEPRDIPPGRFAVLQDPRGGTFMVIRLKG